MRKRVVALVCITGMIIGGNGDVFARAAGAPVSLSKTSITLKEGTSKTITVKKTGRVSIKKKIFKTSDRKVAAVTKKGKVTAKKAGKATIKVQVKYKKGKKIKSKMLKCQVTVTGKSSNNSSNMNNNSSNNSVSTAAPCETSGNGKNPSEMESPVPTGSQNPSGTESPSPIGSQIPSGTDMPTKKPDTSSEPTDTPEDLLREAGLFDKDGKMIKTWGELREEGSVEVTDGILVEGDQYDLSGKLVIGDDVTEIGESAFTGCGKLKSVTMPEGVMSIGDHAFEYSGLTSVTIPEGVTSIGEWAFLGVPLIIYDGDEEGISQWGANKVQTSDGTVLYVYSSDE